jgi:hypothetical protein
MNTVGAVASSAGAYTNIRLLYNELLYIYYVFVYINYVCKSIKKAPLSGPQNQRFNCIMHFTTLYKTSFTYIHFENELFPTMAGQQRQHVDAIGCRTSFSGLISMFVFDILQIPGGCIQICRRFIAAPLHPPPPWLRAWL